MARAARDEWIGALHASESPNRRKGSNEWAMDRLESLLALALPLG
jgi:hypothetical protein